MDNDICFECSGTGKKLCPECSGTGYRAHIEDVGIELPLFSPTPNTCLTCGGSGEVVCIKCGGTGKIQEEITEPTPDIN